MSRTAPSTIALLSYWEKSMFGIGMNEMLIIGIIALVVVGPKRFPEIARTMGKMMAQFKRATNDLRDAVNDEISTHEDLKELKAIKSELEDDIWSVQQSARDTIKGASADAEAAFSEMNPNYTADGPFSGISTTGKSAPNTDSGENPDDSAESFSRSANAGNAEASENGDASDGAEGANPDGAIAEGAEGSSPDGATGATARSEDESESSPKGSGSAPRET